VGSGFILMRLAIVHAGLVAPQGWLLLAEVHIALLGAARMSIAPLHLHGWPSLDCAGRRAFCLVRAA